MDEPGTVPPHLISRYRKRWALRSTLIVLAALLALAANIGLAISLPNNQPNDAKIYSRIATNVIESGVFSHAETPPLEPSLIRLPGYPLMLAGIYSIAGEGNNGAVRLVQSLLLFLSALLAGATAAIWKRGSRRIRRKAGYIAFFLAALCPFTAIYSTVILTEAVAVFLLSLMVNTATRAIASTKIGRSVVWWVLTGITAGTAVEMRPDCGLFAAGLGITLLVSAIMQKETLAATFLKSLGFGLLFLLVLTPWTIRNYHVFGIFQPLAPAHAEMPGEFVPHGYYRWLRTWIDDSRYIEPMLWSLEEQRIDIKSVPEYAFANDDERLRVAALLNEYNNSDPDHPLFAVEQPKTGEDPDDASDSNSADDEVGDDPADNDVDTPVELDLKITADVDTGFALLADERIARDPMRYYVELPAIRAASMWFDTHSEYYPFAGELFPLKDLDNEKYQGVWLPVFGSLTWLYTLMSFAGLLVMWRSANSGSWIAMVLLLTLPRAVFFGTLENPEPRYLVELFIFPAILGGIALSQIQLSVGPRRAGIFVDYVQRTGGPGRSSDNIEIE